MQRLFTMLSSVSWKHVSQNLLHRVLDHERNLHWIWKAELNEVTIIIVTKLVQSTTPLQFMNVLAHVLLRLKLTSVPPTPVRSDPLLSLRPRYGMCATVSEGTDFSSVMLAKCEALTDLDLKLSLWGTVFPHGFYLSCGIKITYI